MVKIRKIHRKNHKIFLIIFILLLFMGMGVGFSYLNASLSINGNVTVNKPKELLINKIKKDAVLDNIASQYVTSSTGIDFSQISSDTNGKGVYILSSTKDDTNPIYYYRGAVTNNNVKLGSWCWKIVRTTETGGIKLIYNGWISNGVCNNTGEASQIGGYGFNEDHGSNAYVGYMYGSSSSNTYDETHKNTNNSTIKKGIDSFYGQYLTSFTNKLEDTVWCNDRSVVTNSDYTGNGVGTSNTLYGAKNRLVVNKTPSLECVNSNDRFTVDGQNGNGKLTYSVATLTADEIAYAGGVYHIENTTTYLYTGKSWWTLSPLGLMSTTPPVFNFYYDSMLSQAPVDISPYIGVRPSISLKPGFKITSGDGSVDSPYMISMD